MQLTTKSAFFSHKLEDHKQTRFLKRSLWENTLK